MKLLSHSNGLHTVEKEKISKLKIIKRCLTVLAALFAFGFIIQMTIKVVDNTRLKSKFKYVRIDGNKMEYRIKGSGDYTVVFDGAIGTNLFQWDSVCKELEQENVSTFVYNRNGYGFNDGGKLTPEEQAQALKKLLKNSGANSPYILVGEEYGSLVLTNFAKLYPESVAGIVLVNPIDESELKNDELKSTLKWKYYRSKFEAFGSNFYITSLLDKLGLVTENKTFENSLNENQLEEFNSFKNKYNYREAVSNEIKNLYYDLSDSQENGVFEDKPLYIITNKEDEPFADMGDSKQTTVYKVDDNEDSYSVLHPDSVVTGINTVVKHAKKLEK